MVHDSYVDQVVARVETKMLLRGLAPHAVATYIPCVRRFIALLDMVHRDRSPRTRNVNLAAIRFALPAWARAGSVQGDPAGKGAAPVERMLLHVRESKTGPRYVMMSLRVLESLRAYWRAFRPSGPRLFPGRQKQPTRTSRARPCAECWPRWL